MQNVSAFNKKPIKDDTRFLVWLIVGFILVAWLVSPPGNKYLQICFWGNNAKYFWAKIIKDPNVRDYMHYRDQAIYLAKMYPKKPKASMIAMEKAIKTAPKYVPENEYLTLYRDRGEINLYTGDKKSALRDYAKADSVLGYLDWIKVAMLALDEGNYKMARDYCQRIIDFDYKAYLGYGCLAEVYDAYGHPKSAIKIYDIALDRKNSWKAYAGRAQLKKKIGDMKGYEDDLAKAKMYGGDCIKVEYSLKDDTLHPKRLTLKVGE